jgi:hypothetical protein
LRGFTQTHTPPLLVTGDVTLCLCVPTLSVYPLQLLDELKGPHINFSVFALALFSPTQLTALRAAEFVPPPPPEGEVEEVTDPTAPFGTMLSALVAHLHAAMHRYALQCLQTPTEQAPGGPVLGAAGPAGAGAGAGAAVPRSSGAAGGPPSSPSIRPSPGAHSSLPPLAPLSSSGPPNEGGGAGTGAGAGGSGSGSGSGVGGGAGSGSGGAPPPAGPASSSSRPPLAPGPRPVAVDDGLDISMVGGSFGDGRPLQKKRPFKAAKAVELDEFPSDLAGMDVDVSAKRRKPVVGPAVSVGAGGASAVGAGAGAGASAGAGAGAGAGVGTGSFGAPTSGPGGPGGPSPAVTDVGSTQGTPVPVGEGDPTGPVDGGPAHGATHSGPPPPGVSSGGVFAFRAGGESWWAECSMVVVTCLQRLRALVEGVPVMTPNHDGVVAHVCAAVRSLCLVEVEDALSQQPSLGAARVHVAVAAAQHAHRTL